MHIRLLEIQGTGISTEHYSLDEVVAATYISKYAGCNIPDPRGGTYQVLPHWYEEVAPCGEPLNDPDEIHCGEYTLGTHYCVICYGKPDEDQQ